MKTKRVLYKTTVCHDVSFTGLVDIYQWQRIYSESLKHTSFGCIKRTYMNKSFLSFGAENMKQWIHYD